MPLFVAVLAGIPNRRRPVRPQSRRRRGSVLLVTLVVVAMLLLVAYGFVETMLAESEATHMYERNARAQLFADSGMEYLCTVLSDPVTYPRTDLVDNPELFAAVYLKEAEVARGRGGFSVIAGATSDESRQSVRYGVTPLAGRIHLNALLNEQLSPAVQRNRLMALPGMTEDIADAILDWLDEDDTPRAYGAESEYYLSLPMPYEPANGPIDALEELLQVRGVTPELFFGEDANHNGLLDLTENDGDDSLPLDDQDGTLDLGWRQYLTIDSREANRRADGTARIHLNQPVLSSLYDELEAEFGPEVALFVAAYRKFGPTGSRGPGGGFGGRNRSGGGGEGDSGGGNAADDAPDGDSASASSDIRQGIDFSGNARAAIETIWDLLGTQVTIQKDDAEETLVSPWPSNPAAVPNYMPDLLDKLAVSDEEYLTGRIAINHAPPEVLMSIPGMIDELAFAIADRAQSLGSEAGTAGNYWPYSEGLITIEQMKQFAPYLTARSDVFEVQVVGFFDAGGPVARKTAIVDAAALPARIISVRDLTHLGRGYRTDHVTGGPAAKSRR